MKASSPIASAQRLTVQRLTALALGLILLLAAVLRFYALDTSSLWSDEGNTWALVQRSFAQIARDAAADIHPPGYYWLLKGWTTLFGTQATGLRSFSALAGVLLVYVTYRIGWLLMADREDGRPWSALLAALLVAVNPFLIYYSQEARMYQLLTLASAGLAWGLLGWLVNARPWHWSLAIYGLAAVVGLWTHYIFPVVMAALGLGYLLFVLPQRGQLRRTLPAFLLVNLLAIIACLPWLPTGITRLLAWPAERVAMPLTDAVPLLVETLLVGPLRTTPQPLWPWLVGAGLLALVGSWAAWQRPHGRLVVFWWLGPLLLSLGAGLLTEAFLKFLLVAVPAWALLVAAPLAWRVLRIPLAIFAGGSALTLAWLVLPPYYQAPDARDNYQGVARYLAVVADPTQDLVVLDAPGQQEVWQYYDPGLPVLALPQQRPPDVAATEAALAAATQDRRMVYALFWATGEADPAQLVEGWLNRHAFPGVASWQGNLRFVSYSLPTGLECQPPASEARFGEALTLTAYCLAEAQPTIAAGDVLLVGLHWQSSQPLTTRYKVTLQLLDGANQVIAQRDSEPVGGSLPTDQWSVNTPVVDNHGLAIPVGTPPGSYQLILALYDRATGARLPVGDRDYYRVGEVAIERSERPFPADLAPRPTPGDAVPWWGKAGWLQRLSPWLCPRADHAPCTW